MMSHRICIASNQKNLPVFANQHLVSCPFSGGGMQGCGGGKLSWVAKWMVQVGVVSEQCFPYSAHDSYCRSHCKPRWTKGKVGVNNGMPVRVRDPWVKTHAEAGSAQYLKGERQMQLAILEGGPIVASL